MINRRSSNKNNKKETYKKKYKNEELTSKENLNTFDNKQDIEKFDKMWEGGKGFDFLSQEYISFAFFLYQGKPKIHTSKFFIDQNDPFLGLIEKVSDSVSNESLSIKDKGRKKNLIDRGTYDVLSYGRLSSAQYLIAHKATYYLARVFGELDPLNWRKTNKNKIRNGDLNKEVNFACAIYFDPLTKQHYILFDISSNKNPEGFHETNMNVFLDQFQNDESGHLRAFKKIIEEECGYIISDLHPPQIIVSMSNDSFNNIMDMGYKKHSIGGEHSYGCTEVSIYIELEKLNQRGFIPKGMVNFCVKYECDEKSGQWSVIRFMPQDSCKKRCQEHESMGYFQTFNTEVNGKEITAFVKEEERGRSRERLNTKDIELPSYGNVNRKLSPPRTRPFWQLSEQSKIECFIKEMSTSLDYKCAFPGYINGLQTFLKKEQLNCDFKSSKGRLLNTAFIIIAELLEQPLEKITIRCQAIFNNSDEFLTKFKETILPYIPETHQLYKQLNLDIEDNKINKNKLC